jgi:predicted MPP superfamily phosphohydrolase
MTLLANINNILMGMHFSEQLVIIIFLMSVVVVYSLELLIIIDWIRYKHKKTTTESNKFLAIVKYAIHSLAIIGILCMLYGYFIEPYWIEVNRIDIRTVALKHSKIRVIQISDLHCDMKMRNEEKLVDIINSLKPDIVVFIGDTINTPEALPLFKKTISAINAPLGKFAVRGNFDDWYWHKLDLFSNTGFEVLDCDKKEISIGDDKIYIAGVSCANTNRWREAINGIPLDKFSVFLDHYPDLIEDISEFGIGLYLSGHTHGGQVALPFYGALTTLSRFGKKYEKGMYKVGDTTLYINRGIGMEGGCIPRVRFLARPEITIFDISPQ